MSREDYLASLEENWIASIHSAFGENPSPSSQWTTVSDCITVLSPFMGKQNHAFWPTGGGLDVYAVRQSHEEGCIELDTGDRSVSIMKPATLTFEYIPDSPRESFLLLELAHLRSSGVYDGVTGSEELVELEPLEYHNRGVWDDGCLGYDENDRPIALPADSRLVTRFLEGKVLIAGKASMWNQTPSTYDGVHNKMSAQQIRAAIEKYSKK